MNRQSKIQIPAASPATAAALMAEVDDALTRETLRDVWDKYRFLIIGAVVAVLIGVGGYEGYRFFKGKIDEEATTKLSDAMAAEPEERAKLLGDFAKLAKGPVLRLYEIVILTDKDARRTGLASLMNDRGLDPVISDYARLSLARDVATDNNEDATRSAMDHLSAITRNSPWFAPAAIDLAALYGASGEYAKAVSLLEVLEGNKMLPQTLQDRAQVLLTLYRNDIALQESAQ